MREWKDSQNLLSSSAFLFYQWISSLSVVLLETNNCNMYKHTLVCAHVLLLLEFLLKDVQIHQSDLIFFFFFKLIDNLANIWRLHGKHVERHSWIAYRQTKCTAHEKQVMKFKEDIANWIWVCYRDNTEANKIVSHGCYGSHFISEMFTLMLELIPIILENWDKWRD